MCTDRLTIYYNGTILLLFLQNITMQSRLCTTLTQAEIRNLLAGLERDFGCRIRIMAGTTTVLFLKDKGSRYKDANPASGARLPMLGGTVGFMKCLSTPAMLSKHLSP